jgi:hypothetical protein
MGLTIAPYPHLQLFNNSGAVLSGGSLHSYAAGTDDDLATYSDEDGTVANANPIALNSAGRPWNGTAEVNVYLLPQAYKFVLKNSAGTTIWTADHIPAVPTLETALDITGTAGEALAIREIAYLSDGSGGQTAGRWYKTDADNAYSSSTAGIVAIVTAAIASGDSAEVFRLQGRVTGFSALVAGSDYYVSATAGGITATAPVNQRFVGRADSTTSLVVSPNPSLVTTVPLNVCEGRLTLTTAVPVTTADVTAATTLYFAPYAGNRIALFDGSATWKTWAFSQLSIAVPATTATMYDVWVYDNSGTPALELLAWTNDTTRATALTTQNGVLVKTGATTRRYVGSFRTTGVSGQTEDSFANRLVWNYYNRVHRPMRNAAETANSWTYTTATLRQANANATNQLAFVVGVAEVALRAQVIAACRNDNAGVLVNVGIGLDSTSANATGFQNAGISTNVVNQQVPLTAQLVAYPAVGYHYAAWLEYSQATGTTTWIGDDGAATITQSGISGGLDG